VLSKELNVQVCDATMLHQRTNDRPKKHGNKNNSLTNNSNTVAT